MFTSCGCWPLQPSPVHVFFSLHRLLAGFSVCTGSRCWDSCSCDCWQRLLVSRQVAQAAQLLLLWRRRIAVYLRGSCTAQCQSDAGTNSGGFCWLDAAAGKKITRHAVLINGESVFTTLREAAAGAVAPALQLLLLITARYLTLLICLVKNKAKTRYNHLNFLGVGRRPGNCRASASPY